MLVEILNLAEKANAEDGNFAAVISYAGSIHFRERPDLMKKLAEYARGLSEEANGIGEEFPEFIRESDI